MYCVKKVAPPPRVRKVYFAHPINTYHTPLEEELLALIRKNFMGYEIINPSDAAHAVVVSEMKRDDPNANVMAYFEGLVMPCHSLLVLPFPDGRWGAGVYREAEVAIEHKLELWIIDYETRIIAPVTRLYAEDALSIEETKARVYNLPLRTIRPYI